MVNHRTGVLALAVLLLMAAPSCKKNGEDSRADDAKTDVAALEAPAADAQNAGTEKKEEKTADSAKTPKCPVNPMDPDGLYADFFDCSTPFPTKDGKAAKYEKSWKEGDDGASMNGYVFKDITQAFIDEYKKRLEEAGYANDMPREAPPAYEKKLSESSVLRVHLNDTLCHEWLNDCDDSIKTGELQVETAIMTFEPPTEAPDDRAPMSPEAEKIAAAYNHPADPDKLYAGLPKGCVFPIKDGKALKYTDKTDLLDSPKLREPGVAVYSFVSSENFDVESFISEFYSKTAESDPCKVTWDGGEGELNLRFRFQE